MTEFFFVTADTVIRVAWGECLSHPSERFNIGLKEVETATQERLTLQLYRICLRVIINVGQTY